MLLKFYGHKVKVRSDALLCNVLCYVKHNKEPRYLLKYDDVMHKIRNTFLILRIMDRSDLHKMHVFTQ